jgi:hypothetical protein
MTDQSRSSPDSVDALIGKWRIDARRYRAAQDDCEIGGEEWFCLGYDADRLEKCANDLEAVHNAAATAPTTDLDLRLLVDIVWNHATESIAVPSSKTADMLIAKYRHIMPIGAQSSPQSKSVTLWQILRARGLPLDQSQWICNDAMNAGIIGQEGALALSSAERAPDPVSTTGITDGK